MPEANLLQLTPPRHETSSLPVERRILLHVSSPDDEEYTRDLLSQAGHQVVVCATMEEVCVQIGEGCGLVILEDETLEAHAVKRLVATLYVQPSWSEVPVTVLMGGGEGVQDALSTLASSGRATNITLIEQPFQAATLTNTVSVALGARERQYQVRDLLREQRATQERLQSILESISDGFVALDRDWRFTYINASYMKLVSPLFESASELLGQNLWEKFPDIIGTPIAEFYGRSMEEQKPGVLELYYEPVQSWLEVRTHPSPETLSIYVQDITPRKKAEAEREASLRSEQQARQEMESLYDSVRNTAERLGLALEAAELGDWAWDAASDMMNFSPRAAALFGVQPGVPFSRADMRLRLHEDDQVRSREVAEAAARNRTDYSIEYRIMQPGGGYRWALTTGRMTFAPDGSVIRMLGVVQDITSRKEAEESLQNLTVKLSDQAQVFNTTLSHITDFAYTFNLHGRFTYANKPMLDLLGLSLEELVGKNFHDLNYPHDLATRLQGQIQQVIDTAQTVMDETAYTDRKGEEGYQEYILSPVLDAHGKVATVAGSTRVITERKRAEVALREARARLDATLFMAEIGTWTWDIQADRVQADKNLARLFFIGDEDGYTGPTEIFMSAIHEQDRERILRETDLALNSDHGDFEADYRLVDPMGGVRWVTARGRVQRDEQGRPAYFPGVVIDITQRKLQEEAFAELSQEINRQARIFDSTLSNIADLAYAFDTEARFTYANKAVLDLLGLPLEEVLGKNVFDLKYPEELANKLHPQLLEVVAKGKTIRGETLMTSASGVVDTHEYIFNPVFGPDGTVVAVAGTTRLATERKKYEATILEARDRAENANRAKDRFLAMLSHELRTPLTPVLMTVAVLEEDSTLPPNVQEELRMIRRNVELETKLIDDLLDLSRIISGKLQLRIEKVDLNNAVRDVCLICESQIYEKGIRLEFDLDPAAGIVNGDSARLQQVLWNLLKNAVKFTPGGGRIAVRTFVTGAGCVRIEVKDTGIGIPEDTLGSIFDAFEQGNTRITQQFGGLGLGLAISKALVELHHGTITAHSEGEGRGATFTVAFAHTLPEPAAPATEPKPASIGTSNGARILLAEDHADTARTLQKLLTRSGYVVVTAGSVQAALDVASTQTFDLLLSDLGLPDATGFDLMKAMGERYQIRGIAMSGFGMEEDIQKSRAAGFSEHLIKPVNLNQLRQVIVRVLEEGR